MYTLSEGLRILFGEENLCEDDMKVFCTVTTPGLTLRTNRLQDTMACYTFTLVVQGWLTIEYNNQQFTLTENDLYPYAPGMPVRIIAASDDYQAICLMADETFTLRSSNMLSAIRAAYFSLVELTEPKLQLQPVDAMHLADLMRLAIHYVTNPHPQRDESLRLLYNLFLIELDRHAGAQHPSPSFPKTCRGNLSRLPAPAVAALRRAPRHRFLCSRALHHYHLSFAHRASGVGPYGGGIYRSNAADGSRMAATDHHALCRTDRRPAALR